MIVGEEVCFVEFSYCETHAPALFKEPSLIFVNQDVRVVCLVVEVVHGHAPSMEAGLVVSGVFHFLSVLDYALLQELRGLNV